MRSLVLAACGLLLVACTVDTTGVDSVSNRSPKGNPDSTVLVEVYADFQCPACRSSFEGVEKPLLAEYGDRIRFEFKHFPLRSIHPYALEAAEAAECAADQDLFWEYHDLVYSEQAKLSSDQLRTWAGDLGMDTDLFNRCIDSKVKRSIVIDEFQDGRNRGVNGTPTFFVDGEKVASTLSDLSAAIDRALGQENLPL